jgi:hypothetical protein
MVYDCRYVLGFRLVYGSRSGSIRKHKILVTKLGFHHIHLVNDIHSDQLDKDIKTKEKETASLQSVHLHRRLLIPNIIQKQEINT